MFQRHPLALKKKTKKHYLTSFIGGSSMAEYTVWILDFVLKMKKKRIINFMTKSEHSLHNFCSCYLGLRSCACVGSWEWGVGCD